MNKVSCITKVPSRKLKLQYKAATREGVRLFALDIMKKVYADTETTPETQAP